MSLQIDDIKTLAASITDDILRIRRHIHSNPELSFHEFETAAFISAELTRAGIEHDTAIGGGTGIRACIQGAAPAPEGEEPICIALRADMDALPIIEETKLEFASTHDGVMHACGHDAHCAMLLGAAFILNQLRAHYSGTIILLFQPAEEKVPGGALGMIKAGALTNPVPSAIIGQHVNPGLPAGVAGFRPGLMMASADDFAIIVRGKGGHGASPHLCIDPIVIAAQLITTMQQIVSRMANPEIPTVLTFGRIHGNGATNVIPGEVRIEGTFRTVNETWRKEALDRICSMASQLAAAQGGSAEVIISKGYPVVKNDSELNATLHHAAIEYLGKSQVVDLPLVMWAEDFAYYGDIAPACFYNLGIANNQNGWTKPLHNPQMMVDETALTQGAGLMAWLALSNLC